MKNTTTPKTEEQVEIVEVIKNIVLEGVENFRAVKTITTFKVVRELHPKTNSFKIISKEKIDEKEEDLRFSLVKVTPEKLAEYRKKGISSFVLKVEGELFYSAIPDNISFVSSNILGSHKCATAGHECHRLSAATDENGGCEKVRKRSKGIERFSWIETGYETFNTGHDSFVVVKCLHYEECPPSKKFTITEINEKKLRLAQFVWDDVGSLGELITRNNHCMKSNFGMY